MTQTRLPSSARRAQLVEAALDIISREGVARLTAANLGKRVGISDATVFRHFQSMEAVVDAAIEEFESVLFADFPPTDADPILRLRSFFFGRIETLRRHPEIMRLAFSDRLADAAGKKGAARIQVMVVRSFDFVRNCLQAAVKEKKLAPDISIDTYLMTLTGVMRGLVLASGSSSAAGVPMDPERAWADLESLWRRSAKHYTRGAKQ